MFRIILAASTLALAAWAGPTPYYSDDVIIQALAGTYELINTTSAMFGVPVPDAAYGDAPIGIITYTTTGWMSANIAATEPELRPNLQFPFSSNDSDADWALVGKHTIGYAGPFSVSRAIPATALHGQIFHGPLTVASVPSWVNAAQRRNYTIFDTAEGRLLRIDSQRDGGNTGVLWWKKIV